MEKEIFIKLYVDGKEGNEILKITNQELQEILNHSNNVNNNPPNIFDKLTDELLKYNLVSDESISNLTQWLTLQNVNSSEIEKVISALKSQSLQLNINSSEWVENQTKIMLLSEAYSNIIEKNMNQVGSTKQVTQSTSQMTYALGQLGWVLGDANMFMVNFRMGMMSIANNIPMVIQGFIQAKAAAEATGTTIRSALVSSLTGPGGLMLAINGLMFLLQILPNLFDDTTKSVKEQKEEIDKLKTSYEKLTRVQLLNELEEVKKKLRNLEYNPSTTDKFTAAISTALGNPKIAMDSKYLQDVNSLGNKQKAIEDSFFMLGDIENIQNRININQQKLNDLNEDNFNTLVKQAKTRKEAEVLLKNWIQEDELKLGKNRNYTKTNSKTNVNEAINEFVLQPTKELEELTDDETFPQFYIDQIKQYSQFINELRELQIKNMSNQNQREIEETKEKYKKLRESVKERYAGEEEYINKIIEQLNILENKELRQASQESINETTKTVFELRDAFTNAGEASISAFTSSIQLINNNNSILQNFINNLGKAIIQLMAYKAAAAGINVIGNLLGIGAGIAGAAIGGPAWGIASAAGIVNKGMSQTTLGATLVNERSSIINLKLEPVEFIQDGTQLKGVLQSYENNKVNYR